MATKSAQQRADALKAISDPRRRELLTLLREAGVLSVSDLTSRVSVSQQAVSLHLKVLADAGLVEARREGTRHLYAVRPEGFRPVQEFVDGFWSQHLSGLKKKLEKK